MAYPLLRNEKGAPLTHEEMDENWLRAAVQLGVWRSDFYYTNNEMVALNGVIYKSLSGNLNKLPSMYPADWAVWTTPHTHGFADITAETVDDAAMTANSHVLVPTQWSVKQFVLSTLASISYTDDDAKDAAGDALADTNSIDFTYNAGTRVISADVRLNGSSLSIDASGLFVADDGISAAMIQDNAVGLNHIADGLLTETKLDIHNGPSDGYALLWNNANAKMTWTDLAPLLYTDEQAIDALAGVLIAGAGISIDLSDPHAGITVSLGATFAPSNYALKLSDDTTPIATSVTPIETLHVPFDMQVSTLSAALTTVSSSGDVVLTISRNGTPILTDPITIEEGDETSLTAATPPEATAGELDWVAGDKIEVYLTSAGTGATGLKLSIGYAGMVLVGDTGQASLQFQEEGVDLGTAGNVTTLDFVGDAITASRVGSTVTVTVDVPEASGGLSWVTVSGADTTAVDQTGFIMLTGGTLREVEIPASVAAGFITRVVSVGEQVRILSNGNTIANVGAGNDLLLDASRMVELVATSTGNLQITDYCVLP